MFDGLEDEFEVGSFLYGDSSGSSDFSSLDSSSSSDSDSDSDTGTNSSDNSGSDSSNSDDSGDSDGPSPPSSEDEYERVTTPNIRKASASRLSLRQTSSSTDVNGGLSRRFSRDKMG